MRYLILALLFSFGASADEFRQFSINGDIWAIEHKEEEGELRLCLQTSSICKLTGVGVLYDYKFDRDSNDATARVIYQRFIDRANLKLKDYYNPTVSIPDEDDFTAFIDYLIKEGTQYNEGTNDFSITK